jgi:hypothetical protein
MPFARQRLIFLLTILFFSTSGFAGLRNLTIHSRANCGNNESISWQAGYAHDLLTVSEHLKNGKIVHRMASGWEYTWRSANVHWGEALPGAGWTVQAGHYIREGQYEYRLGFTKATDCSFYNGWWDH